MFSLKKSWGIAVYDKNSPESNAIRDLFFALQENLVVSSQKAFRITQRYGINDQWAARHFLDIAQEIRADPQGLGQAYQMA